MGRLIDGDRRGAWLCYPIRSASLRRLAGLLATGDECNG